ncbi:MAG: anthranilate synthase component I family protein [Bacteroidetes bacterium]|nr:anthranilate synthase component I family protein [Bacteroidota bacterium]
MLNFSLQEDYFTFAKKLKQFAAGFNPSVILDSCNINPQFFIGNYKIIAAFGGNKIFEPSNYMLEFLNEIYNSKSWYFGVIGYNLKNEIENLDSKNKRCFGWNEMCFFSPETVVTVDYENVVCIYGNNPQEVFKNISETKIEKDYNSNSQIKIKTEIDKKSYISKVNRIKNEIINGNVYELNLCLRFLYENFDFFNPFQFYNKLTEHSPSPFSGYFAAGKKYVSCASPERFLSKKNRTLISQPIKGTIARGKNEKEDISNKNTLKNSIKDRAENVMIVDLVRNDLAKVSVPGSVKVDELFGVYSYSQVHQMVSTISSELKAEIGLKEIIKATFPMGSMTGAPKISAMQKIEYFEDFNRQWYSGSLGYISPWGDFDFNVLIRTAFYDKELNKLAFYSGGAITIDSNPIDEYEEIFIKVKAIISLLNGNF